MRIIGRDEEGLTRKPEGGRFGRGGGENGLQGSMKFGVGGPDTDSLWSEDLGRKKSWWRIHRSFDLIQKFPA